MTEIVWKCGVFASEILNSMNVLRNIFVELHKCSFFAFLHEVVQ